MKKLIIGAVLGIAAAALPAQESEWLLIIDSTEGNRLYGQKGSLELFKDSSGVAQAGARFRIIRESQPQPTFTAVTSLSTCRDGQGPLFIIFSNDTFVRYYWDLQGNKLFDVIGANICAAAEAVQKQQQNQSTPANNKELRF